LLSQNILDDRVRHRDYEWSQARVSFFFRWLALARSAWWWFGIDGAAVDCSESGHCEGR
jgi:hypothetical protein